MPRSWPPGPWPATGWVHERPSPTTTRARDSHHPVPTPRDFLATDDPPPLLGVKLVRPRLRRKRLRLRALQLDTSHATATNRASYEEAPQNNSQTLEPRRQPTSPGPRPRALLTRPALMGAVSCVEDHARFDSLRTSLRPDQTSSTAHTLTSTTPSGSASSRIPSSVRSVGTPDDFFGHAIHSAPAVVVRSISVGSRSPSRARSGQKAKITSYDVPPGRRLTSTPPGTPSISNPEGALSSATACSGLIPSFAASGFPE